ncbi:MAG TPA: FlgO family outer membrane protein [Chitinispirillaceae bacterium]|jgi:TolB-like protein|nr:FlgO family outer membrane protein [Chitinispirillaceae bacterium]
MYLKIRMIIFTAAINAFCSKENDAVKLIDGLCDSLVQSIKTTEKLRLAVLPFSDKAGAESEKGKAVAEIIVSNLDRSNRFTLVERGEFQKMLQEIELSQTDLVDEATAVKAGKIMAADAVLSGSITDVFGSYRINARIIRTETGEILASVSVAVAPAALDGITKELLGEKVQVSSSIFRSLLAPGWGQYYTNHPGHGTIFLSLTAVSAGFTVWSIVDWSVKSGEVSANRTKLLSKDPDEDKRLREKAVDERDEARRRAAIAGSITGAVWAINLIDAAILGGKEKNKIRELYFSFEGGIPEAGIVLSF